MSSAAFSFESAYALLKARLDRAGLTVPLALEEEWQTILRGVCEELGAKGIVLVDDADDYYLVAEMAAQRIRRDAPGGYTEELRHAILSRFLKEGLKDGTD